MGSRAQWEELRIKGSESLLGLESDPPSAAHLRYLTIDGRRAYEIGITCETCAFLFKRLGGANQKISPTQLGARLRAGVAALDHDLVETLAELMPDGLYRVGLIDVPPELVRPGDARDYFANEQVDLFGIDTFWNLPHDPRTEYYRGRTLEVGEHGRLFEFVVPMVPGSWLKPETVSGYESRLAAGDRPTALAFSVLDVKQPFDWEGEPRVTTHWCLAHFVLDGHHKLFAAARTGATLGLLAFLNVTESVAGPDAIQEVTRLEGSG